MNLVSDFYSALCVTSKVFSLEYKIFRVKVWLDPLHSVWDWIHKYVSIGGIIFNFLNFSLFWSVVDGLNSDLAIS